MADDQPEQDKLDLDNLPPRFTQTQIGHLTIGEFEALEAMDLTPEQRQDLDQWRADTKEKLAPVFEPVLKSITSRWNLGQAFGRTVDPLGARLQTSIKRTEELSRATVTDHAETIASTVRAQRQEEADRWQRQHDLTRAVAESTALLAERTEQQHREADRQRARTWLLAYVAIVATGGTLVQIGLRPSEWVLGAAAIALLGVWLIAHLRPGREGEDS